MKGKRCTADEKLISLLGLGQKLNIMDARAKVCYCYCWLLLCYCYYCYYCCYCYCYCCYYRSGFYWLSFCFDFDFFFNRLLLWPTLQEVGDWRVERATKSKCLF